MRIAGQWSEFVVGHDRNVSKDARSRNHNPKRKRGPEAKTSTILAHASGYLRDSKIKNLFAGT
jgi:hypothetical protein